MAFCYAGLMTLTSMRILQNGKIPSPAVGAGKSQLHSLTSTSLAA
jgi:hypothetical protein